MWKYFKAFGIISGELLSIHFLSSTTKGTNRMTFTIFFPFEKIMVQKIWGFISKRKKEKWGKNLSLTFYLTFLLSTTLMTVSIISAQNADFELLSGQIRYNIKIWAMKALRIISPQNDAAAQIWIQYYM